MSGHEKPISNRTISRWYVPELEDYRQLPAWFRDLMTDCLQSMMKFTKAYSNAAPILSRVLTQTGHSCVIDFGSGGTGPLLEILPELTRQIPNLKVICTDLYPNETAAARVLKQAQETGFNISYSRTPIDMSAPPSFLPTGVRVMFTSFHHLSNQQAIQTIHSAVNAGVPLAVFEITGRTLGHFIMTLGVPFAVLALTPFMQGKRLTRFIATYVVPVVPLGCLWDGLASNCRTFSVNDLQLLVDTAEAENVRKNPTRSKIGFSFEIGTFKSVGPLSGNYLLCLPTPDAD